MDILHSLYPTVSPLGRWIEYVDREHLLSPQASDDSEKYIAFLSSTLVCQNHCESLPQPKISLSQISSQSDVVLKVIQKIRSYSRGNVEENVLLFGFGEMSDDANAQISDLPDIEYRFPNSSVNKLMSGHWKRLHRRIGDSLMEYLLEHMSVYSLSLPSSYIQITGKPAYSLVRPFHSVQSSKKPSKQQGVLPKKSKSSSRKGKARNFKEHNQAKTPGVKPYKTTEGILMKLAWDKVLKFPYSHFQLFPRRNYFCTKYLKDGIPNYHILNTAEATEDGARSLCTEIFKNSTSPSPSWSHNNIATGSEMESFHKLLREMIQNHKDCKYKLILNCCCPASLSVKRKTPSNKSGNIPHNKRPGRKSLTTLQLLNNYTPPRKVFLFTRRILLKILPKDVLGPNKNKFLKYIEQLVCMGKFDKFGLGEIMRNMKTKHLTWLHGLPSQRVKLYCLSQVIYWLVDFVMVILKAFFYVTESARYRNRLFYYRKHIWQTLHHRGWMDLKSRGIFQRISKEEVTRYLKQGESLGVSSLRFLPKPTSLRPLINLGLHPPAECRSTLPINKQLLTLKNVLTHLQKRSPESVGFAVQGVDDIYQQWKNFIIQRKAHNDRKPLYFVKTDISNCYDEIDQNKLFAIIRDLLLQNDEGPEFITRRYVTICKSAGRLLRKFCRHTSPLVDYEPDFFKFITKLTEMLNIRNMVLVNQVVYSHDHPEDLLQKLQAHLFKNLIKVGRQYLLQTRGISQGSVLSTLLCNLYYGQLERRLVQTRSGEIMMRVVDDALFVTPSLERATDYLTTVVKGIPEFNFTVNCEKLEVNFPYSIAELGLFPAVQPSWIKWCGLVFNTETLEVVSDYSKYEGLSIKDTMSFDLTQTPTAIMKNKLRNHIRLQCHAVLVDPAINSTETMVMNCHKLLLLLSYKFHCYNKMLPYRCRVDDRPSHFMEMITSFGQDFFHRVNNAVGQVKHGSNFLNFLNKEEDKGFIFTSRQICELLNLQTFEVTLRRHHSLYKGLLKMLTGRKRSLLKQVNKKAEDLEAYHKMTDVCRGWTTPPEFRDLFYEGMG